MLTPQHVCGGLYLECEPRLHLEHPRRVDVCERRERVSGRPDGRQLAKRRERRPRVAVRRYSAAEDRRLVNLAPVEPAADLRIGAHALSGAVDDDLRLLGADQELHFQSRGLARAQRDVLELLGAESFHGNADRVGSRQRQRRNGGAAVASRDGLAHGAWRKATPHRRSIQSISLNNSQLNSTLSMKYFSDFSIS